MLETIPVQIKKTRDNAVVPCYMTELAAGLDLFAALDSPQIIQPGQRSLIPTGIAMAIPPGYEGQVRPRSGLALRKGFTLVNSPGTIDADYRGEIGILVINHGQEEVTVSHGDRIAQLVIAPVKRAQLLEVEKLDDTIRNAGGFGHTGVQGGGE